MLRYKQLNSHQKKTICNGCGGKGGLINPPEFLFHASCNHHDFRYWRGCTEADRKDADDSFYKWMKVDIAISKWYLKPYYHLWAWTYYKAVRLFGKKYFYYVDKPRTLEDLEKEINK